MKLIYLDTETTGLDSKRNCLVQLAGIIRVDGKEHEFNYLMSPLPGKEIDPEALAIQGRTEAEIRGYPEPRIAYLDFCNYLGSFVDKFDKKDKFFMLAYNARFDDDFLRAFFDAMGDKYYGSWFWNPALDVMQAAAFYLIKRRQELPNFKLATVYEAITGKPLGDGAHDALVDIRATRDIAKIVAPLFLGAKKEEVTP